MTEPVFDYVKIGSSPSMEMWVTHEVDNENPCATYYNVDMYKYSIVIHWMSKLFLMLPHPDVVRTLLKEHMGVVNREPEFKSAMIPTDFSETWASMIIIAPAQPTAAEMAAFLEALWPKMVSVHSEADVASVVD